MVLKIGQENEGGVDMLIYEPRADVLMHHLGTLRSVRGQSRTQAIRGWPGPSTDGLVSATGLAKPGHPRMAWVRDWPRTSRAPITTFRPLASHLSHRISPITPLQLNRSRPQICNPRNDQDAQKTQELEDPQATRTVQYKPTHARPTKEKLA